MLILDVVGSLLYRCSWHIVFLEIYFKIDFFHIELTMDIFDILGI